MKNIYSPRLSSSSVTKSDIHYLHYVSLHRDIKHAIEKFAKGKILDIGCGNKPYEKEFKTRCSEYIGCDIEQSSIEKVDIICDATNIPLESDEFDTVFCTQTIEHIPEFQKVINESYRLLKKEGYFIISGPMYWHLHEEPNDYHRFTKYGFAFALEKAGFKVKKVYENGGAWATSGQALLHAVMYSNSKNVIIKFIRFLYNRLIFKLLHNSIFGWLDKKDFNPVNTMNYIIVASK